MGIVLKNLKLLSNGKYQYRRVWPEAVRRALPELGRELKQTFELSVGRDDAILMAVALNKRFDQTVRKIRENKGELPAWELMQRVQSWHRENEEAFATPVYQERTVNEYGQEIFIEETAADLEVDHILNEAAKRSGYDALGHPKRLTKEELLKLEILKSGQLAPPPLTVQEAYELYRQKKKNGRDDKYGRTAASQFMEFAGNIPISSIRSAQIMDWLDHLVTEENQVHETVKKRLGGMKSIVNFAKRRGAFEGENPFVGHKVPEHAKAPKDRLPFHTVHLDAIDHYLANSNVRDDTRWIIALLKNTGCRPSEIGGLKAEDLSLESDIPFALVRWTEDRRLKTHDSERRVPLIGEALEAARLACKRHTKGWLFPKLAPTDARLNDNQVLSARINKVIRRAGIPATPQLVCYSFRHTMAAALDQTPDLAHAVRERALGRKRAQYGAKELPLSETFDALSRAILLLGKVDEVLYAPSMLEIGTTE